jgi:hypothetical protein
MARSIWTLLIAAVLVVLGYGVYVARANSALDAGFNAVMPGMPRQQVISMMAIQNPKLRMPGCSDLARQAIGGSEMRH